MVQSLAKWLTSHLIDWLIVITISTLVLWFVVTQPSLSITTVNSAASFLNSDARPSVDATKLKQHVTILTQTIAPRTLDNNNLAQAADYILQQFGSLGFAYFQTFENIAGGYNNVVLELGPSSDQVLVFGAHYDASDNALSSEGNASGIAALLELARVLANNNSRLSQRIILVAYPLSLNQVDRSEFTGSYFHASELHKSGKEISLMVSLDSVGRFTTVDGSQRHTYKFMKLIYPDQGNYINAVSRIKDIAQLRKLKKIFKRDTQLPIYSLTIPQSLQPAESNDHRHYWRYGYPAILLSDTQSKRSIENNDKNLSIDAKLDYAGMAELVVGLYTFAVESGADKKLEQVVQSNLDKASNDLQ